MTLPDIENLTFAELKARRDELIAEAAKQPVNELAGRYVKARTDAKMRDESLGEQAGIIKALQDGSGALQEKNLRLGDQLLAESARADANSAFVVEANVLINRLQAEHAQKLGEQVSRAAEFAAEAEAKIAALEARCGRLKGAATRNQAALTGAATMLNAAISSNAIEAADGE